MLRTANLFKYVAAPAIAIAFCCATVASAQTQTAPVTATAKPKPKLKPKPRQVDPPLQAAPQTLNCGVLNGPCVSTCEAGAGRNSNGACVSKAQAIAVRSGRLRGDAMVGIRTNDNNPANILPSGIGTSGSGASSDGGLPANAQVDVFGHGPRSPGSPSAGGVSDVRVKRDITPLEILDDGVMLYSFRYFWSDQVYVGVMAQQVEALVPEAVEMHANGYFWVNYDRLGLKMQTWEEWQAQKQKSF